MKQIDQERLDKRRRQGIVAWRNALMSQFSFKKIKTYRDLLLAVGYTQDKIDKIWFPSELNVPLTAQVINDYISDRKIELEAELYIRDYVKPSYDREITIEDKTIDSLSEDDKAIESAIKTAERELEEEVKETEEESADYGYIKSSHTTISLYWFQRKAAATILKKILGEQRRGIQLVGETGIGKTIICGAVIRHLRDIDWHKKFTKSPWPYIVVTKARAVEQTKRILRNFFGLEHPKDVFVINIDQLRSKFGELFIDYKTVVINGQETNQWVWRDGIYPVFMWWDENHVLKNATSQQHQIAVAYNELANTVQVFSSATPFFKVCEAKVFAVSTRISYKYATLTDTGLNNNTWPSFAKWVAHPSDPAEYNDAAIGRLMDILNEYVVNVKNVKLQFHPRNHVEMIDFVTKEGYEYYHKSFERYQEKKAKVEKAKNEGKISALLYNNTVMAQTIQYRIAAESNPDRISYIGNRMYDEVYFNNKAAVCALEYKISVSKLIEYLVKVKNVPRDQICVIWGGITGQPSEKQKAKAAIEGDPIVMAALQKAGITMEDLHLDDVEAKQIADKFDPSLKLHPPSKDEIQRGIDRFNKGIIHFCIYTFKCGGTAISLPHSDEMTKKKVRRRKSGYAYVQDIPLIPTRERVVFIGPTWSPVAMVQGMGRVPRVVSLSDTHQYFLFFKNTIEVKVAKLVSRALKCLKKVTRQLHDSWEDIIIENLTDDQIIKRHLVDHPVLGIIDEDDDTNGLLIDEEQEENEKETNTNSNGSDKCKV